jgi:hypothetical protein
MSEALLKVPDAALEQARMMLDRARWGATRFQKLDRATTRRIVDASPRQRMPRHNISRMGGANRHGRCRPQTHKK